LNTSVTVRSSAVAETADELSDRLKDVSTERTTYQYVAPSSTSVSVKSVDDVAPMSANGPPDEAPRWT
jgi:hypothetical protein